MLRSVGELDLQAQIKPVPPKEELEEILRWIDSYRCVGLIQTDALVAEMRKAFPEITSDVEAKAIWEIWRASLGRPK